MSASVAAATRAGDDDDSDMDLDDVEEVMEEEEEEEEEVNDLSHAPNDITEDRNDASKEIESEGHKSHLESGSSTQGKSKARLPSDALAVGESRSNFKTSSSSNDPFRRKIKVSLKSHENGSQEYEVLEKDVGAFPQVKTHEEQNKLHTDSKVHLCSSEIMDFETTGPPSVSRKNVATAIQIRGHLGEGISAEEIEQMDMASGDDEQGMASRFASSVTRTRSLSPGAGIKDGNKRPAVICDFFTKGWCIKGNLCRFLHVKDDINNNTQHLGEDAAAANEKTEIQFGEGSKKVNERSQMPCFPDPQACSVRNNVSFSSDFSSKRILPLEPGESRRLPQFQENHRLSLLQKENTSVDNSPSSQQLASSRDDVGFILSSKDVGSESSRQSWPVDDYRNCALLINRGSSSIFRNSLLPEYRSSSSGSVILSSNYHRGNPSSCPSGLEERPCVQSKYMHNDYSLPVLRHSLNSSLGTSGQTASSFPSHHVSAWPGLSLPFYSSTLNASPHDAQKLLDSDRECRNSRSSLFLGSTSPFSVSEPVKPLRSTDYETKTSSNDWEPSVPFRPSFFISSPGSQYDPLRDSFDSPKIGNASLKAAISNVGVSTLNTSHQQLCGDSISSKTIVPDCNGDKSSVSSHGRFTENVLDKDFHALREDSHSDGEEIVGTSIVNGQNGTTPKEDDPSVSNYVKDTSKSDKIKTNCDSRHQNDECRRNELKVDRARKNNEMGLEKKTDADVRKESKAIKHFRAGLVDFVKELLKPTWREGHLSKDAHNTIVRKAVDKVLSTLQPNQIPTSLESIKHYLSLSQPKLAKLVEGYVDKYGKS